MNQDQPPETRQAIFYFVDGTQMTLEWPRRAPKGVFAVESAVEKAAASRQLMVEVGGNLMVIEMANVKYFEVIPAPERLPEEIIRNARRLD